MNFTMVVLDPVDTYGGWNHQMDTWTGVIGQVVTDEADIGAAEFTLTSDRLKIVDFTMPLIYSRSRLYFKQPESTNVHWSGYFRVRVVDYN